MRLSSLCFTIGAQQTKGMKDNEAENLIYNAEAGDHNERMHEPAILAAAGTATAFAAESIAKSNSIGTAAAEEKALLDAGVSSADANFGYTDFDFEKGSFVYEVEFTANGIEWEYVIKASDGTVLSRAKVQQGYADAMTPGLDTGDTSAPVSEESDAAADASTPETSTPETSIPETSTPETSTPVQEETDIGLEAAKNAALADAGVSAADATFTEQKRDREDGVLVYDIDFYTATMKYEYEIDASTGAVREKKSELRGGQTQPDNTDIGLEAAKNAALAGRRRERSGRDVHQQKRDREDGVLVYDIDFYTATMKYEYEIDASTGAVRERKSEKRNNQTQTGANDIGLEAAKNAALADAGVNAADATFTEQKRDREDGVLVYDIDFYTATMKYEYEIDASTGAVREKKAESKTQTGDNGAYIGLERAKEIALCMRACRPARCISPRRSLRTTTALRCMRSNFTRIGWSTSTPSTLATGRILEFDAEYDD